MRPPLLAVTVAATIVGCGSAGRGAVQAPSPATAVARPPASSRDDSVDLPQVGTLTARCPATGRYRLRFDVNPDHASDQLTVLVGRTRIREAQRDPGGHLSVRVAVHRRTLGPDLVRETKPVVWRIVQETEPHTIRATIRVVLLSSDEAPAPACRFEHLRTSLTTRSHSGP
jgi:hypothetical protein